jgi:hypothetical protein
MSVHSSTIMENSSVLAIGSCRLLVIASPNALSKFVTAEHCKNYFVESM